MLLRQSFLKCLNTPLLEIELKRIIHELRKRAGPTSDRISSTTR